MKTLLTFVMARDVRVAKRYECILYSPTPWDGLDANRGGSPLRIRSSVPVV